MRDFTWLDDSVEHSDSDYARARALAKKWNQLHNAEEQRYFRHLADVESGYYYGPEPCDECDACLAGNSDKCDGILAAEHYRQEQQAERDLEIELVEEKLALLGARMMRPYEHWNEDERYMQYMESDRFEGGF